MAKTYKLRYPRLEWKTHTGLTTPITKILSFPAAHAYRLVRTDAKEMMIPPDVARGDLTKRSFNVNVAAGNGRCPSSGAGIRIQTNKKRTYMTVTREMLLNRPAGWLNGWTADLESEGCISVGAGSKLAEEIAWALPLEMNQSFHLLYSDQIDVTPQMRLQVVSPILDREQPKDASTPGSIEASNELSGVTLTASSGKNLIGYEIASYSVRAKAIGTCPEWIFE